MDRTANPLFKAGMAAITATALIVAPAVTPPTRQSISLPDIRSASVRLSSLAFTPRAAEVPASPLAALKLSLSPASAVPTSPLKRAPISQLATAVQPRAAAAPSPTPVSTPAQPEAAATPGPVVASSLTNGVDQAYQFIQYWVDYGVDLAQWGAGFVPVIGGLVSAQIGIVYDNLVRPIANSFVYNLVDPILNDPSFSSIVNSFGRFGSDIVNSVINFAWAEARYFLPPLPPLPGLALQTTTDANGAAPTSVHEALVPFTKAFKDAETHFAEALGLTKPDPKSAALEKTGTAAQTTGESPKEATGKSVQEEGKATEAGAATGTKEALDRKESAEGKASANDKATAVAERTKAGDKATTESREPLTTATEVAKESAKDSVKDAAVPGVAADADAASGNLTKGALAAKETGNQKQSVTERQTFPRFRARRQARHGGQTEGPRGQHDRTWGHQRSGHCPRPRVAVNVETVRPVGLHSQNRRIQGFQLRRYWFPDVGYQHAGEQDVRHADCHRHDDRHQGNRDETKNCRDEALRLQGLRFHDIGHEISRHHRA